MQGGQCKFCYMDNMTRRPPHAGQGPMLGTDSGCSHRICLSQQLLCIQHCVAEITTTNISYQIIFSTSRCPEAWAVRAEMRTRPASRSRAASSSCASRRLPLQPEIVTGNGCHRHPHNRCCTLRRVTLHVSSPLLIFRSSSTKSNTHCCGWHSMHASVNSFGCCKKDYVHDYSNSACTSHLHLQRQQHLPQQDLLFP